MTMPDIQIPQEDWHWPVFAETLCGTMTDRESFRKKISNFGRFGCLRAAFTWKK